MPGETSIRLIIADDHALIRDGLRKILSLQEGLEVVAEASDGQIAYTLAGELTPDLILMDINMRTVCRCVQDSKQLLLPPLTA